MCTDECLWICVPTHTCTTFLEEWLLRTQDEFVHSGNVAPSRDRDSWNKLS